jgi:hypothetical protein
MTKNKQKIHGHDVRLVEKDTDINPTEILGRITPISAHGVCIMPTLHTSNLESILWVSTSNFMKIKAQLEKETKSK